MKRSLVLVSVIAAALSGCLAGSSPFFTGSSWSHGTYTGFDQDIRALTGPEFIDCGLLHMDSDGGSRAYVRRCAREAVASDRPFRFGYCSWGDDSMYCDIAIRAPDGQLWSFWYDSDVTGQAGRSGNNAALRASRCASIVFEPGTIGYGSFFRQGDCVPDDDAVNKIVAVRNASRP
ncbi:MAG: hypothetical protein ABI411_11670 [Tahibacter sp.]